MGANSSSEKEQYIEHSRLGKVRLDKSIQNQDMCDRIQMIGALPSFDPVLKWLQQLKNTIPWFSVTKKNQYEGEIGFKEQNRKEEEKFACLLLPIKYSWKNEGLCGQGGVIKVQYEAFLFTLQVQIENRREEGKYFLQTEIWFLLFKLVQLLREFDQMGKMIGNLHPRNVLIDENGQIKVLSRYSLMEELDVLDDIMQDSQVKVFLAPEQLQASHKTQSYKQSQVRLEKGEIFSLGMIILCAATLSSGEIFYQMQQDSDLLSISFQLIEEKLKSLAEHYSTFLLSVVQTMIKLKPSERKSAGAIYDSLKEYEKDIVELHPFLPDYLFTHLVKEQRKHNEANSRSRMIGSTSNKISKNIKSVPGHSNY